MPWVVHAVLSACMRAFELTAGVRRNGAEGTLAPSVRPMIAGLHNIRTWRAKKSVARQAE